MPLKSKIIVRTLFSLLVVCAFARCVDAKTHYLLIDVSGSMKNRYVGDFKSWLIQPLLNSNAFSAGDRVIIRWFDQRGNTTYVTDDRQRVYAGNMDTQAVLGHVPTVADARGANTDLLEAIKLAEVDIQNLKIQGDVLIWMLTDNEQDVGGKEDPTPFYQGVVANERFRAAYLFPLIREKEGRAPDSNAMVLYLFLYSQQPTLFKLDSIADSASKKVNNPAVTWFPVETGIEINPSNIKVNDEPAMVVNNKLQLPAVSEGETPNFSISFPFTSKLRARKLVQSQIKNQKAILGNMPPSLETRGDVTSWNVDISPKTLTIDPNKDSEATYHTTLKANDLTLHPASFSDALWNSTSDPVNLGFQYTIEDDNPKIESPEIAKVKDLDKIASNMRVRPGQKNVRPGQIEMSFNVQYNSLWRRIAVGLAALVVVGLALGASSLFFVKSRYQLTTPFGEETLILPVIGRRYVTIGGDRAAIIKKTFGNLSVSPVGTYLVNGGMKSHRLADSINNFEIANQVDNRQYQYTLSRTVRGGTPKAASPDGFLD